MTRRIALFANGKAGVEIAKFLAEQDDEVVILSLAGQYLDLDQEIEKVFSGHTQTKKCFGDLRDNLKNFQKLMEDTGVDTIITVYWPYLLPEQILSPHTLTVNFHPALLPLNRGWYPHVHNILDGSPAGVTLHKLSQLADEGDIWLQKEVPAYPWDLASDLYLRLQNEIVELFKVNWSLILSGKIVAMSQSISNASYHAKKEIEELDYIDLNMSLKVSDLLNLLRARTFGEKGFAYFVHEGERIRVRIQFERENP